MPTQNELRQQITDQIIAALNSGGLPPWRKPWRDDANSGTHTSLSTGQWYRGVNQILLQLSAMKHNFQSRWWGTYRQIQQCGAHVCRGEKGTKIVLYKPVKRTRIDRQGDEVEETIPILRQFTVFNAEQTSGLEEYRVGFAQPQQDATERYEQAEAAVAATGADIRHGGSRAFYKPHGDYIQLPYQHQFESPEAYWETAFHELVHWSERPHRLDLNPSRDYAMGELVAEMGACFIASELNIPNSNTTNHAAYLKGWLQAMQNDPKFIFKASSQASKAADYVLHFSRATAETPAIVA